MPRRRYDDDYDDEPRRRPKSGGGLGGLAIAGIVGSVLLVCGALGAGYLLFAREMSKPKPPPPPVAVAPPPAPVAAAPEKVTVIVRLSNPRKPTATRTLEVDYIVEDDAAVVGAELYLVVKSKEGTASMRFTPDTRGFQTVTVGREADFRGFGGETQAWVEKATPGGGRERVSNVVTAYY